MAVERPDLNQSPDDFSPSPPPTEPAEENSAEYVQDDKREKRLRFLFDLEKPEGSGRSGTDAILVLPHPDSRVVEFELKSATAKGITTARGKHSANRSAALAS